MAKEQVGGTQVAVISTEHSLATVNVSGSYVLAVDLVNLAAGDTVELRIKVKTRSGSTIREAILASYTGDQTQEVVFTDPAPSPFSIEATLKQTAGTGRSFDWSLYRL